MGQKLVGPQTLVDGVTGEGRIGRTGEEIFSGLHGKFYEQAKRGNVYSGATAVSGVAPGTAIGTTAAFALYNPLNSGIDLVILKASMSYLSGTLGIGFVNWIMHTAAVQAGAAVTGTAISVVRANGQNGVGVGKPLTTATVVAGGGGRAPPDPPPPPAANAGAPRGAAGPGGVGTRAWGARGSPRRARRPPFGRRQRPARPRWSSTAAHGKRCRHR